MQHDITELTEKLRAFSKDREWAQFHSPKNLAMALSVECGELLENFQWLTEDQSRNLTDGQRQSVQLEIADVFLYLLQLCDAMQINILDAAKAKLVLNEKKYPPDLARGVSTKYTEL